MKTKNNKSIFYNNKKLFENFASNKTLSFKVDDNKLLKRHSRIWEIISNLSNIEFNIEPVYGDNDKYIKTKIKMYENRVNTNFQGKELPKGDASYMCLSLIVLRNITGKHF